MKISIEKYGKILISRPAGKEAAAMILISLSAIKNDERIDLDFGGVNVVAPSWLDEVLTALKNKFGERVNCLESKNSSLNESLKTLRDFP